MGLLRNSLKKAEVATRTWWVWSRAPEATPRRRGNWRLHPQPVLRLAPHDFHAEKDRGAHQKKANERRSGRIVCLANVNTSEGNDHAGGHEAKGLDEICSRGLHESLFHALFHYQTWEVWTRRVKR
jgi:hypothetical protein